MHLALGAVVFGLLIVGGPSRMPAGTSADEVDAPATEARFPIEHVRLGLSFDLHGGLRVFATGKSFHVVRACNDLPSSGKTHGPRPGDSGQWFKAFWTEA